MRKGGGGGYTYIVNASLLVEQFITRTHSDLSGCIKGKHVLYLGP